MNRSKLKTYAPQARRDFIRAMTDRAAFYGLTKEKIEPVVVQGDVALIGGKAFPSTVAPKRERLEERVQRVGFEQTMEAMAYTWFNRLVAIRYMELHGYLDHGYRVLSHPEGKPTPEIVEHAEHVDLPGLDREEVIHLKLDGTKEAELYRKLLIAQCNALHVAMPFLFERIADETELLLPDSLLHSDSLVRKLVTEIDEADWQEVEIIGWLYQFYISEKKAEVIGSVVKSEDIPAATQLFTPNWIVKYLVQNSVGRQWLATYPDSSLKAKMEFYIEPAEQTPEVQAQLKAITPESLNPEELTFLDPACGSGHILVEAYSLLRDIYLERGYRLRDIPKLILTKNLFGLEIDDRAAQLAAFALLMMARADDRNILSSGITLNVLAIQQTNHLDTEALLQAFTHTKLAAKQQPMSGEFGFMDEVRAPLYTNTTAQPPVADPLVPGLRQLLDLFRGAKTFGSLVQVPPAFVAVLPGLRERVSVVQQNADLTTAGLAALDHLIRQADLLARQYSFVAANPPYMGRKSMTALLKAFGERHYPDSKADLFAMFIDRCLSLSRKGGCVSLMTPFVWMFLLTYERIREKLTQRAAITSLVQPQYHTFFESAAVPICAFAIDTAGVETRGTYFDLTKEYGADVQPLRLREAILDDTVAWRHIVDCRNFAKLKTSPIAYWTSDRMRDAIHESETLADHAHTRQGLATGDNAQFLRYWHEVPLDNIGFGYHTAEEARQSCARWFPCNKGGAFRRWYGNNHFVVDWQDGGQRLKSFEGAVIRNESYYFKPGLTWSSLTIGAFSMRWSPAGFMFESKGSMCFPRQPEQSLYLLAFLNTKLVNAFLRASSPTLDYHEGPVGRLPFRLHNVAAVTEIAREAVALAKEDWDSHEQSWEFVKHPLVGEGGGRARIREVYEAWCRHMEDRRVRLAALETQNNRSFAAAFELDGEVSPEVGLSEVTLRTADVPFDVQTLLSYAIGCTCGRFSLDKPGLVYADSGNEGFDPAAYATFPADKDGIIPVTEEHWFAEDAAARFGEFVSKAWPAEHLDENLAFVADGLGAKNSESPRQTIRRYLSDGFYKHHLQTYKRRPIYWLFTSGKQRAFQALVYLHRYNEGTLSRMRTEYVIPLQGKIAARIEKLEADKAKATSTSHGKSIQKEQDKLRKQQQELITFDEKLRHYADLRIKLDLDDGVKVNYRKFADPAIGEIVAEVKAVCGKEDDE